MIREDRWTARTNTKPHENRADVDLATPEVVLDCIPQLSADEHILSWWYHYYGTAKNFRKWEG